MPKAQHDALEREGRKRGYRGKRLQQFVYGTMTNQEKRREGSMPKKQMPKGRKGASRPPFPPRKGSARKQASEGTKKVPAKSAKPTKEDRFAAMDAAMDKRGVANPAGIAQRGMAKQFGPPKLKGGAKKKAAKKKGGRVPPAFARK